MSIELKLSDIHILEEFKKIIPCNSSITTRVRNTNFKKGAESASLHVHFRGFRDTIIYFGVPYGKKCFVIKPPEQEHSEIDYWRGIIDADGSLGFTGHGKPFISLVTASGGLANAFMDFIFKTTGYACKVNRNKRDSVYNITCVNEKAQKIVSILYYVGCLAINRKYESAKNIIKWARPDYSGMSQTDWNWKEADVAFLINNTIEECFIKYKNTRTPLAISLKRASSIKKLSVK